MSKRVALVLGSGGARGYAHIGVIEELTARGYEIVAISGCSMGAIIGGMYAAGQLESYRDWVSRLTYLHVLRLIDVTWSPLGAMRATKVMEKLKDLIGEVCLEELPIPLTTVATDLTRQREVWFQSGSLLQAIRASIAVPGIITPVETGEQILVDGGLLNPLPIIPTVSTRSDLILAVNATAQSHQPVTLEELLPEEIAETPVPDAKENKQSGRLRQRALLRRFGGSAVEGEPGDAGTKRKQAAERAWGKLDIMLASFEITQAALAKYKVAGYPPDILVEIPKTVCGAFEFHRAEALIRLGRHLAAQALDRHESSPTTSTPTERG